MLTNGRRPEDRWAPTPGLAFQMYPFGLVGFFLNIDLDSNDIDIDGERVRSRFTKLTDHVSEVLGYALTPTSAGDVSEVAFGFLGVPGFSCLVYPCLHSAGGRDSTYYAHALGFGCLLKKQFGLFGATECFPAMIWTSSSRSGISVLCLRGF